MNSSDQTSNPEKVTKKKVSRACNTCRLKRTKCDGHEPCASCTTNSKAECSYSHEPRRRGPPSGYLRYIETKVNLLETFLGLVISRTNSEGRAQFVECANDLRIESKESTQDVWDACKNSWNDLETSKILEEIVLNFAPFVHNSDHDTNSKPLLPAKASSSLPRSHSVSLRFSHDSVAPQLPSQSATGTRHNHSDPVFHQPTMLSFDRRGESFERTQIRPSSPASPTQRPSQTPNLLVQNNVTSSSLRPQQPWSSSRDDASTSFLGTFPLTGMSEAAEPGPPTYHSPASSSLPAGHYGSTSLHDDAFPPPSHDSEMVEDLPPISPLLQREGTSMLPPEHEDANGTYTGSYWRNAEALEGLSPSAMDPSLAPSKDEIELPPNHILSQFLDVYYTHVHPVFPVLPLRHSVETFSVSPTEVQMGLLLALSAYIGRLSPSFVNPLVAPAFGIVGEMGKIAADLWYEQSRTILNGTLRKRSKIETIQTLLLLALRDQGKGNESQAWLLLGLAVRIGQDLALYSPSATSTVKYSAEETQTRSQVWGVVLIVDLYVSLQLGRPSAFLDGRYDLHSIVDASDFNLHSDPTKNEPSSMFLHTVFLCQIISKINFTLYLGFGSAAQQDALTSLKNELDVWHSKLPLSFRVSIGHHPAKEALELNMLFHVAIILLYRPFRKDRVLQAAEISLDAAATFNMLMEKYRLSQGFTLSNPHMIYMIFTVAIAHLSGLRQLESVSTTATLQTQVHLLSCLDALKTIGVTWDLATRCGRTLDKLLEVEKMKPPTFEAGPTTNQLGKRKRGDLGDQASSRAETPSGTLTLDSRLSALGNFLSTEPTARSGSSVQQADVSSRPPEEGSPSAPPSTNVLPWAMQPSTSNPKPATGDYTSTSPSGPSVLFFDPDFFSSSTGWLPPPSSSLRWPTEGGGEWDEEAWGNNFFGGGPGQDGELDMTWLNQLSAPKERQQGTSI